MVHLSEVEEKKQYTDSAKADYIKNFLEQSKEDRDILYKFTSRPYGKFPFNPMREDQIFEWFLENTDEFMIAIKRACVELIMGWGGERLRKSLVDNFHITILDSNEIKMAEWDATYEGVPVAVNVQVIGAFQEETYTKEAAWICEDHHVTETTNLGWKPFKCSNPKCDLKDLRIAPGTLKTGPVKVVMIQEPLEEAKHSSPKIFPCVIKDDDVKHTFIGQRKKIVGIFRSEPQKGKSTNRIMIHAISVQDLGDTEEVLPDEEEAARFKQMSKKEDYISKVVDSFAPEVKFGGTELAKLCLILSILGGNKVGRLRGFIHALLVGDPSTAKSKMLEFIQLVVQKSGFAVGGTASGSGITVSMDTLPNRMKMPRAGLIPNCTGGCAAIDELNQLDDEDLGKVFESMESGMIHYNKGGFDLPLIAETAIQAGANPRGYYYDKHKTIVDNVHLPGPLLSRFDLKILMMDDNNSSEESQILDHMFKIRDMGVEEYVDLQGLLHPNQLMALFNLAKTYSPKMTEEAEKIIKDFHMSMKSIEQPTGSFRIDKRFAESIGRIATAYAKLHFSKTVSKEMAMMAIEIYKKTLRTFGMNVERGEMQLSLEDSSKSKETAFFYAFKEKQEGLNETFLQEEVVLKALVTKYPGKWKNLDEAALYFDRMWKSGKIIKRAGRFNIA